MDFPFNFLEKNSILFAFFFFGMVFSVLSLRKGILHQSDSTKWLSFFLLLSALYITPHMLGYSGWYGNKTTRNVLFFVPFMQVLVIGPVVYFYVQNLLDTSYRFQKKDWLHFIPGLLYFAYSLIVYITDQWVLDRFYFYADYRDKDLKEWYQLAGLISMVFYLILSLRKYLDYKKNIFDVVSYADSIVFRWVQNFLLSFITLLVLRVLFFLINPQWEEFGSQFWYFLSFSLVFFYIAISGYAHAVRDTVLEFKPVIIKNTVPVKHPSPQLNLKDTEVQAWKEKLMNALTEDLIYTNPQLTLNDVAHDLKTNSKLISWIVNKGFEMNFNDLINFYRVEAVKEKIHQKEHLKTTLLGIALDSGFNSKATFNRAFKKATSLTPKAYIESVK